MREGNTIGWKWVWGKRICDTLCRAIEAEGSDRDRSTRSALRAGRLGELGLKNSQGSSEPLPTTLQNVGPHNDLLGVVGLELRGLVDDGRLRLKSDGVLSAIFHPSALRSTGCSPARFQPLVIALEPV